MGLKRENPEKNHLAHPQAELGLSHMWPERHLDMTFKQGTEADPGFLEEGFKSIKRGFLFNIIPDFSLKNFYEIEIIWS